MLTFKLTVNGVNGYLKAFKFSGMCIRKHSKCSCLDSHPISGQEPEECLQDWCKFGSNLLDNQT